MTRPARYLSFGVLAALTVAGPAAAQAPPPNASFVLHNGGAAAFREVYVSASSDPNWGPDRTREVSGPPLVPGRTMVVLLPGEATGGHLRYTKRGGAMSGGTATLRRAAAMRCADHATGNGARSRGRSMPSGCRPSRIASMISGESSVSRNSVPR